MKSLLIIWVTLGLIIVGGFLYMNNEINKLVVESKESVTSGQIREAEQSGAIIRQGQTTLQVGDNNGGDQLQTHDPQPAGRNE